jgi:squalene-hopene/tetraprenyl-beta-curcumene cyclase
MVLTTDRLESAYQTALTALLAERTPEGHWVGELSTSALSTAVAVSALASVRKGTSRYGSFDALIAGGLHWLAEHQNIDGGWGDTVKSFSNISTTMLCRAAFRLAGASVEHAGTRRRCKAWLAERYGKTPEQLVEAIRARYGKDRTFSVPILMTSALAGLVAWDEVPSLPFELACFPQSWFRFLRLPVVSYALPALIAIGQAVYHHRPPWNPIIRWIRRLAIPTSLRVLQAIQPSNGGFLEATPLTSFVTLGLASIGQAEHPVVAKCVEFILQSVQSDGSWPIDTNLSTWVTTLAINALVAAGELEQLEKRDQLRDWLSLQQFREQHPYTGAAPGGWGWTPLPGSVPDADDTPGALLALSALTARIKDEDTDESPRALILQGLAEIHRDFLHQAFSDTHLPRDRDVPFSIRQEIQKGFLWLANLQNRDKGWPTFCRGWGKLPFDRSGADLTAHVLRACAAWKTVNQEDLLYYKAAEVDVRYAGFPLELPSQYETGFSYLACQQRPDGSWLPLWFGNQHAPDDINPTYGTARVLAAYRDLDRMNSDEARRGVAFLLRIQNADGGWGGAADTPSSIEETALAVELLLDAGADARDAVNKGLLWLVQQVEAGGLSHPTPIGFYFAKLWYFEKLYPIIFTVAALGRARRMSARNDTTAPGPGPPPAQD